MPLSGVSRRALGLFSATIFILLFLGLYRTMTPSHPKSQKLTDKLGLNNNNNPGQASGPSNPAGTDLHHLSGSGRVLPDELILHHSPATYPRLTRLSDGSILLAFTRFEGPGPNPTRILAVERSTDNGRTFVPWGEVTRCEGDCGNLFLLEVPSGSTPTPTPRVLAAFRNHDVIDPKTNRRPTYFRITVCESHDGGRTWTYLTQAAEKPAPMGLWEPFMRIGTGSRGGGEEEVELQMTYSQELEPRDQDTIMRVSYDRGQTWSPPTTVTGAGETLRDGMTGIAATTDERDQRPALVMVFETTRHGTFSVESVVSYDDGATWGHRQVVFAPPPGANAGAPQIESFANGGLATVFMTDMDVDDGRKWPKKATVKTVFGGPLVDGKIQWSQPQITCPRPSFWPGIFRLNDTQLWAVCEHGSGIQARVLEWDI